MTHRTRTDWDWGKLRALCLSESRRVLGPAAAAAADDAAQEATLRAWRHRARCHNPAHPEPWIRRIARREALRILARRPDVVVLDSEAVVDTRQEFSEMDDFLDLRRALRGMEGQDKYLLVGRYWQDLSDSELAMQLGLAEVTVRVRLHRIRQRLRDTLMEI